MSIISLSNSINSVSIENGELISFTSSNVEYIHQKGNPGWRKSDDEMFPVIGPLDKNNYRLQTKKGVGILDQHGLLRELNYQFISHSKTEASFQKKYKVGELVRNNKFPEKSSEEFVSWPFDFEFTKRYSLSENKLHIEFTIQSVAGMPYMLGYHPAFLLTGNEQEILESGSKQITLQDVYEVGSNAFPVLETNEILLKNDGKPNIKISTENFNNFMLWTEVPNMICIEPITQYTSYTDQKFSEENMRICSGKESFGVLIEIINN